MPRIPTIAEMEHFTAEQFGADMDHILDRVSKENTAFIIDSKEASYVLCPASWIDPVEEVQTADLLRSSLKLAVSSDLSSQAEVVAAAKPMIQRLSPASALQIRDDLNRAFQDSASDVASSWQRIRDILFSDMPASDSSC